MIVMDLFARNPIGWAMFYSPDIALTGKALPMVFEWSTERSDVSF